MSEELETALSFLNALFRHADDERWLSLFAVNRQTGDKRTLWARVGERDQLAQQAAELDHHCVWIGAATRTQQLNGKRGGREDCGELVGFWVDVDVQSQAHKLDRLPPTFEDAQSLIDDYPLKPTLVVHTGNGLQPWWLFQEPIPVDECTEALADWAWTWQERGRRRGWHVDNTWDVARILRLPGTTNWKVEPKPVHIIGKHAQRYGLDDLGQYCLTRPAPETKATPRAEDGNLPGNLYNRQHTGGEVLANYGFTLVQTDRDGTEHWVRPDKDPKDGASATVYADDGHTTIWSDTCLETWPTLALRRPYDPFGLYTHFEHDGDFGKAARALDALGPTIEVSKPTNQAALDADEYLPEPIDWAAFDQQDFLAEDWLAEPFLARGRSHALYARAKQGKSLFALDVVAALATGRPVLDQPASDPVHVTYLDYEMTLDDLFERLDAMGYIGTDRSHLHYYLLPTLPPLDTKEGGAMLAKLVERDGAELVVVDTTSRAVEGEENDADTIRAYYRHTGARLKQAGVTQLRIDHAGKDRSKGQRGSSAKDDDVDVVWELEQGDKGQTVRLMVKRTRMGWVRDRDLARRDDPLRYATPEAEGGHVVEGTGEVITLLDALGVPVETTVKHAAAALRNAGHKFGQRKISDAVRSRKRGPNVRIGVTE